ncbi:MAG: hypothetical protein KGH75_09755 [Rhodospirillales bacterium]|nr:hypothetical protein [Rhodospirillales bacterium]
MSFSIDPKMASILAEQITRQFMDLICASTPMLSWLKSGSDRGEGGSAFLVRTPTGILGITAKHVIDGFLIAQGNCPGLTATLGGFNFDLSERLIARGVNVDIATFRIYQSDLASIGFQPLNSAWPPEIPQSKGIVLVAGWPGQERITGQKVTGGLYVVWGSAGVSEEQITIKLEHQDAYSPLDNVPIPDQGFKFGGISGGPVMMIDTDESRKNIKWRVAGIIAEGKSEYDYIVATRADVIQDDGKIAG